MLKSDIENEMQVKARTKTNIGNDQKSDTDPQDAAPDPSVTNQPKEEEKWIKCFLA